MLFYFQFLSNFQGAYALIQMQSLSNYSILKKSHRTKNLHHLQIH